MSHISTSLVTHINESCHTYEWVMSHQGMPIKASYNDTSYHTYERVKSHITTSQVTHINESCCTYQRVTLHIWMSHAPHTNESCHTYEWVLSHIWMSHVTPGHADQGVVQRYVISHIWKSQIAHNNKSGHAYQQVMLHISTSHVAHMNESCHTYQWFMSHIWMSPVTHMNESCHARACRSRRRTATRGTPPASMTNSAPRMVATSSRAQRSTWKVRIFTWYALCRIYRIIYRIFIWCRYQIVRYR